MRKIILDESYLKHQEIKFIEKYFITVILLRLIFMKWIIISIIYYGINPIENKNGKNIERLLFNHCLYRMTLSENIYILNENNYNKSIEDFREDFNVN